MLRRDELFGIYPEGTRSPDGRLYKGKTGIARMALEAGCPVIPVAMIGTDKAAAHRAEAAKDHADRCPDRGTAGFQPLRRHGERPVRAAVDHRRDHVRAHAVVRPGVRRRLCDVAEEERSQGHRADVAVAKAQEIQKTAQEIQKTGGGCEGCHRSGSRRHRVGQDQGNSSSGTVGDPGSVEAPDSATSTGSVWTTTAREFG